MDNIYKKLDMLNIRMLAEKAKIKEEDLYARKYGRIKKPLDTMSRTKLVNAFVRDMRPFFHAMGFEITVTPREQT